MTQLEKITPDVEAQERLVSPLEAKIRAMSPEERAQFKQDALDKYNEMENVIHTINRVEDSEAEDKLF